MTSPPRPTIDADTFRAVFRQHAAGVAIITVDGPRGPSGFTATSLASVSLDPPLVSIAIASASSSWPALTVADGFVVNLLGTEAHGVADRFATPGVDRFAPPTRWAYLPTGEPHLGHAHSWLRCATDDRIPVGDHHLVIGRVVEVSIGDPSTPLLYHDGAYRTLTDLPRLVTSDSR